MHTCRLLAVSLALVTGGAAALCAEDRPYVRVSPRDCRYLELTDGQPFIPVGLNIVGVWGRTGEEEALQRMEGWMRQLADNGGNFVRVWLSSPFWDVEHERCGQYDPLVAQRIDRLLALARKYNLYLKLTLEHFREIDPDDPYAQQRAWATKALHHVSRGGTASSIDDWFTGETSRQQFRRKIQWYAGRYGSDPIVMGWELWNEVNAVRTRNYLPWTELMLGQLRQQFPRNLVMQSLGSFDRPQTRQQYREMMALPGNDVAQVHRYLDLGAQLEVCHGPVDILAADAVRELIEMKPGKPILLAESGAVEPNHAGPFKLYAQDKAGIILHDVLFAPFFAGAAGTGQCWHWDNYVDQNQLWWQFGRFAALVEGLDPAVEQFRPAMLDHPQLRVYALQGIRTTLLWARDTQNTWQAELADGIAAQSLQNVTIDVSSLPKLADGSVRVYDPWENRWTPATLEGTAIQLPPFRRSIAVRISHRNLADSIE